MNKEISDAEKNFIQGAARYLEQPGFLLKAMRYLGDPLERKIARMSEKTQRFISDATERAVETALQAALLTLNFSSPQANTTDSPKFQDAVAASRWSRVSHGLATTMTGAAGGFLGVAALPFELPLTTILMLRSIVKTALDFGADPESQKTQLDCLFVFSMGSPNRPANGGENAKDDANGYLNYYSARVSFAALAREALIFLATRGTTQEIAETIFRSSTPILARLISQVAARLQPVIAERIAIQSIPITGAAVGGIINLIFTNHFNTVAKYHFGIQKLEKDFGEETVQKIYAAEALLSARRT